MKIINLGILAHVDAGKTTTVEHFLYACGEIKNPGSIEKGTTQTDWLPIEMERGISVKASSAILCYGGVQINVIDTPGHTDFTGETERSLYAVDAAIIIISALEGIQSQTEIFWKALQANRIPTIIFINKIDRMGCDLEKTISAIKSKLSEYIIPLNSVTGHGSRECTTADIGLGENEIFILSEFDDSIAECFLEGGIVGTDEAEACISRLTANGLVFPLVFGAASLDCGIPCLLDSIVKYLPKTEESSEGDVSGTVYKIEHDKLMGKIAHVRMFGGCIKNRDIIKIIRQNNEPLYEKVTLIRKASGRKYEDSGIVNGGDIAALYGLTGAKTGDIIGIDTKLRNFQMSIPLYSVQIARHGGDMTELLSAVRELTDEDPLLDMVWCGDEKELIIKVMGPVQIEIMRYLLLNRYNIEASFTKPTVIYKETPVKKGIGFESYTMPKPCWAVVKLEIEPLTRGSGFIFKSVVRDSDIFMRYQNHIKLSVSDALKQGLLNWETIDLKVSLIDGEHHLMHTHPMDFFLATPMAVMNGLLNCGTLLLEPMILMNITAGEEFAGRIIGDITLMRGEFDTPVMAGGRLNIDAIVPVAASMDYPARLASLTAGKGIIRTKFNGYRECAPELGAVGKRRGVNPLDRAKWILKMRNAL